MMDFKLILFQIKRFFKRTFKKIKKIFTKYVRRLVRHTKAGDYSILIYSVLAAAVVIFVFSMLFHGSSKKKNDTATKTDAPTDVADITSTENPSQSLVTPSSPDTSLQSGTDAPTRTPVSNEELIKKANEIYEQDKTFLILVNKDNPLDEGYTFEQHQLNCDEIINALIYDDLADMLQACNDAGYEYNIVSGYRSREAQQNILDEDIASYQSLGYSDDEAMELALKKVQAPGYSEHETGLSLDITSEGNWVLSEDLTQDETYIWLTKHCHEYGFILRYPTDKASITGIDFEPWHFRYVGKDASMLMYNYDLTLEEFHELLTER